MAVVPVQQRGAAAHTEGKYCAKLRQLERPAVRALLEDPLPCQMEAGWACGRGLGEEGGR